MRRLLDLFCGAGGAARGYQRAGFHVTGVDIAAQPRYAGDVFIREDALAFLREHGGEFDAIHSSPPCQAHTNLRAMLKRDYPELIEPTRALLPESVPWVIENVVGAPLKDPITLCGASFPELWVYRHRLFESNVALFEPPHMAHAEFVWQPDWGVPYDERYRVQVTGGGNAPVWAKGRAMGIDWMLGRELNQAIPPAYAEFIGRQL